MDIIACHPKGWFSYARKDQMKAVKAEYANVIFTAEGCYDLPATRCVSPSGKEEIETVWELSDEEVEQIRKEKKIYLYIFGQSMPPVCIQTQSDIVC